MLTIAAATLTTVLTVLGGRRSARAGVRAGRRSEAVAERVAERGVLAVVVQRLLPGVNDAAGGYAFGALGVSVRQVVLGTLLATPPRAFAYTALGDSLGKPASPLALVAFGVLGGMGVLGAVVGWRVARRRPAGAPAGQAT